MGKHHNMKYDHLEPTKWKKGQSGNPRGPKKGTISVKKMVTKWLETKEVLKNPITGEDMEMTQLDILIIAQLKRARGGSVAAFNALMDRLEGKPNQLIQNEVVQKLVARIEPEAKEVTTINISEDGEIDSIEFNDAEDE